MRVVEMANAGEAQVMRVVERPDPTPTPGQVLVAVAAAGVNFMDVGSGAASCGPIRQAPRHLASKAPARCSR